MIPEACNVRGLVAEFRAAADLFRSHADERVACTYERCARRLEEVVHFLEETPLTLAEAAEWGGYSTDHLGRLVRAGKIRNAGRLGSPRVRRADVPIKTGYVAPSSQRAELVPEQIVRSVIEEGVG